VLNEFQLSAAPMTPGAKAQVVFLHNAQADFSQESWPVAAAIDGNLDTGWAIAPQFGRPHSAYFELKTPLSNPGGTQFTLTLVQRFPGKEHNIGRFRLFLTNSPVPLRLSGPPEPIVKLLKTEPGRRTPQQQAELTNYHRALDAEWVRLTQAAA